MLTLRSAIKMKKLFGILVILLAGLALVQTVSALDSDVRINEFVSDPATGNEWVELYNAGENTVDLNAWTIKDGATVPATFGDLVGKSILAKGYLVVENTGATQILNNDGDTIVLNNNKVAPNNYEDQVTYGAGIGDDITPPGTGKSAAILQNNNWAIFDTPTKGISNSPIVTFATTSPADDATITTSEVDLQITVTGGSALVDGGVVGMTASCASITGKNYLEYKCTGLTNGATETYIVGVLDDKGQTAISEERSFVVDLEESMTITAGTAVKQVLLDADTTVDMTFTITNTGQVPLAIDKSDFTASNLIFQALDSSTSYVYDTDANTYREGFYVEGSTAVQSLPSTFSGTLDIDDEVVLTVTYVVPQNIEYYGLYKGAVSMEDVTGEATVISTASLTVRPVTYSTRLDIDVEYEEDNAYRTQDVEISVVVDNGHTEKVKNIKVTLEIPELGIKETSSKFTLDDGDDLEDDPIVFKFTLDDDEEEGDYPIYVYATGDTETSAGNKITIENYDDSQELEVIVVSDDLIIETFTLDEVDYKAGETFTATVKMSNIGTVDQDDARVRFECVDLDLAKYSETTDELKDGKTVTKTFTLKVPTSAEDGSYICSATILYDDVEDQLDDDDVDEHLKKEVVLTVTGGLGDGSADGAKASITGASTTTANVGDVKKFTLNLKNDNTGGSDTYKIQIEGYSNWAESARVEPAELTIPAGTSVPFYAYLTPATGANGVQTATVAAYVGTEKVASQTLTVTVSGTGIQVDDLGNSITGAVTGFNLDVPTAMIISSIVAGLVILGAVYMFTLGKKL
jgi:hypothetical protein